MILAELAYATFATLLAVLLSALMERLLDFNEVSLVFITAVLFVAVRTRLWVAVYAAFACFLAYNFFFIEPRYTFWIATGRSVTTVVMFLVAALICGRLANRLRDQVIRLRAAHAHAHALQTLGQQLAGAADEAEVYRTGLHALRKELDAAVVILAADEATGQLDLVAREPEGTILDPPAREDANWAVANRQVAGRDFGTQAGVAWRCLPLLSGERTLGVACLRFAEATPEVTRLAEAMVQSMAGALARTRLVTQLEAARVEGETERLRAALLSSVSHDLRSPLASIVGSAESLSLYRGQLSATDQAALSENILVEGQRLDRYIQNLLDMTRLGQGPLAIERDWVGLDEICGALLPRLRKLDPGVALTVELPAGLPLLHVNAALIEQALFNVLENAARFSPPGQSVSLSAQQVGGEVHIRVCDRGPGIPLPERERIFDMFYSVERGDRDDRAKPGTGLGLTICQGIVLAHGGRVSALSGDDGTGTTILITLPLAPPPADGGGEA